MLGCEELQLSLFMKTVWFFFSTCSLWPKVVFYTSLPASRCFPWASTASALTPVYFFHLFVMFPITCSQLPGLITQLFTAPWGRQSWCLCVNSVEIKFAFLHLFSWSSLSSFPFNEAAENSQCVVLPPLPMFNCIWLYGVSCCLEKSIQLSSNSHQQGRGICNTFQQEEQESYIWSNASKAKHARKCQR